MKVSLFISNKLCFSTDNVCVVLSRSDRWSPFILFRYSKSLFKKKKFLFLPFFFTIFFHNRLQKKVFLFQNKLKWESFLASLRKPLVYLSSSLVGFSYGCIILCCIILLQIEILYADIEFYKLNFHLFCQIQNIWLFKFVIINKLTKKNLSQLPVLLWST